MRKLFFVLLCIFAITLTSCHAADSPQCNTSLSSDSISTEEHQRLETKIPDDSKTLPDFSECSSSKTETASESFQAVESQESIPSSKDMESLAPNNTQSNATLPVGSTQPQKPSTSASENKTEIPSSTPTEVESTAKPQQPDIPTEPDMESECQRIICEVTEYAQSYAHKGIAFIWDDSLVFGWDTGYMGTPRLQYDGVNGTIDILKYHIDKIVNTVTDPSNGITADSISYKVMQITIDGDIAFVVLYG